MQTRNFEVTAIRAAWESISRMLVEEIVRDPREPMTDYTYASPDQELIPVYATQEAAIGR